MQLVCGMNIGAKGSSIGTRTLNTSEALESGLWALEASLHTSAVATMVAVHLVGGGDLAWRTVSSCLYQARRMVNIFWQWKELFLEQT